MGRKCYVSLRGFCFLVYFVCCGWSYNLIPVIGNKVPLVSKAVDFIPNGDSAHLPMTSPPKARSPAVFEIDFPFALLGEVQGLNRILA